MGYGSYTAGDWAKLRKSRGLDTASTEQIFTKREIDPRFDPKFVHMREARDSEDHPKSTPIMIGVDVTGSMGYLSTQIVKESLNDLMQSLYSGGFIRDPQLLFAAIGDVVDQAPLQVTQFESDIRIAEQLMDLWLEGRGADAPEDYELLWYFAARHTDIDSFNKRGEKGFCISIGDAGCHSTLAADAVKGIFGESVPHDLSSADLATEAASKYELFHILIGDSPQGWDKLLPGRVLLVKKSDIKYLPEIIITIMQIARGGNKENALSQWGLLARQVVEQAISLLKIDYHF